MSRYTSNAALAYDMTDAYAVQPARTTTAPREAEVPRFDVLPGEGRQANQAVSPVFTHVAKVFCVLVAIFFVIGIARVAIAGLTAAELNAGAAIESTLSEAHDQSGELEVMRSAYGSDSRIRDLAVNTLGMVEPEGGITLELPAATAVTAQAAE